MLYEKSVNLVLHDSDLYSVRCSFYDYKIEII